MIGRFKKLYEAKVRKPLCDMLTKMKKPSWMGKHAKTQLLNY